MSKPLTQILMEAPQKITDEVKGKPPEEARAYLRSMSAIFKNPPSVGVSAFYVDDRQAVIGVILENYAKTFPEVREGYLHAFRDTGIFPGERELPLDFSANHLPLEVVNFNYAPSRDNVAVLLKKYSPKQIADAYASRKLKYEVVSALVDNGLTLKDLRTAGIKIAGELREKIFGQ